MNTEKLSWWKVPYKADDVDDYGETLAYNERDARYAVEANLREDGYEKVEIKGAWRLPDYKE